MKDFDTFPPAQHFDVLVLGAGPAGASAALALTRAGRSVAIVDRARVGRRNFGETLPPSVLPLLKEMALDGDFQTAAHARSFVIRSAWGGPIVEADYTMHPAGSWWHVDRVRFDTMLVTAAARAGTSIFAAAGRPSVNRGPGGGYRVEARALGRTLSLSANFLVDATGRSAAVARRFGARRFEYDRLIALIAFESAMRVCCTEELYTLIEARERGWWYSALLPSGRYVLAFFTDAGTVSTRRGTLGSVFHDELRDAPLTRERVGGRIQLEAPTCVSASTTLLTRAEVPDLVAVGDAASAYDPLSSAGVSKALELGYSAGKAIAAALSGDINALTTYRVDHEVAFDAYLRERNRYYRLERRFSSSPFWASRQSIEALRPMAIRP